VLITVAISGSPVATVQEPKGPHGEQRTTTLTFKADSVHMIAGRCSILVPDKTRIICVMLCIWKGSI
jgi:hypothetical protein